MARFGLRKTRWAVAAAILVTLTVACSPNRRSWNSHGDYQARFTDEDGLVRNVNGSVSRAEGITTDHRVRLCDIRRLSWSLPASLDLGRVAALKVTLPKALCVTGDTMAVTGYAVVWGHPAGDTTLVTGIRSEDWTVSGTLIVEEVIDHDPPDPEVGQEVVTESARGTFELTATRSPADTLRLENGSFNFQILVSKYRFEF